jgi:hypothetical protein
MMIRSLVVTSDAQLGRVLQGPLPRLPVPDPERPVLAAAHPISQCLPREAVRSLHLDEVW